MYEISVKSFFSAAHHLENYNGDCENVHGHNWEIIAVAAYAELEENGIAVDFRVLKKSLDEILDHLDHKDLNCVDYFKNINPTSENIAKYVYNMIKEKGVKIKKIIVAETNEYKAVYYE